MTDTAPPVQADREVVVVGGGPAGLQAALTLARVHRDAVLIDAGDGRNGPASHMHNLVTRDGTPPSEMRRLAREELASYPTVEVVDGRVARVSEADTSKGEVGATAYLVELEDGTRFTARHLVLATGVRDELPDVPGMDELWGDLVAHCPFCHGHEFAGKRVGILGSKPAPHLAALLETMAEEVVVLADGHAPPDVDVPVVEDPVVSVERHGEGLRATLRSGETVDVAGLFVATKLLQGAPLAEQLGLELNPSGCVTVDQCGRTSRPGVYAAGDMAHTAEHPLPMASVAVAIASGLVAGSSAVTDLLEE